MKNKIVLAAGLILAACGAEGPGTLKLQFQPAAYSSDGFSTGPTDVANVDGCLVPEDIARFEVKTYGANITNPTALNYNVGDIGGDCALNILLPPGAEVEVVIKAFDASDNLVRKGNALIPAFAAGESLQFPSPLWPAKRLNDASGGEGSASDLRYIEIMRQFDQFLIELAFSSIVYPATRGGDDSLRGYMKLVNTDNDSSYTLTFDAAGEGLTLVNTASQAVQRAEFQFIGGGLQIGLPYAFIGGVDNSAEGVVAAPNVNFSVALLDRADAIVDVFPEEGSESLK